MTTFVSLLWQTFNDAYTQVTVFVALTLLVFYSIEYGLKPYSFSLKRYAKFSVLGSAVMGAIPGCGGAIIVVTQFSAGQLSFGCMVAVLTSTMGDAAFLLLAKEPYICLGVILLSMIVGTLSGLLIDWSHPRDFLVPKQKKSITPIKWSKSSKPSSYIWLAFLILNLPGMIFVMIQKQASDFGLANHWDTVTVNLGALAALYIIMMELIRGAHTLPAESEPKKTVSILDKTIETTNFVTLWVLFAFLAYEIPSWAFDIDLALMFNHYQVLTPLIACLIGFIPGCGPQIIVTSLYLQGVIPLSAQIGNALSNDGDALFPVIAVSPKVGILATLYGFVPAVLIAYIAYFFGY